MRERGTASVGLAVVLLAALGAGLVAAGRARAEDESVTSRDVEQALRTLRDAVRHGVAGAPCTKDNVRAALEGWGAAAIDGSEENALAFTWMGRSLVLVFHVGTGEDLLLRYRYPQPVAEAEHVNAWNNAALFLGYVDRRSNVATLEWGLLAETEPTVLRLQKVLTRFGREADAFTKFLDERLAATAAAAAGGQGGGGGTAKEGE
ncbi:MAG: hypothetical protein AB7T63_15760 [Planctomycetota bacterium]